MDINWCPSCKIGLANEEVVDGKCERCGTVVERKELGQWVVNITEYADKLLNGLIKARYRIEVANTDKQKVINALTKSKQQLEWKDGLLLSELNNDTLKAFKEEAGTIVVYFPIKEDNFTKSKYQISLWEQLTLVKELQHFWADNSVSVTITFKPEEASDIKQAIEFFTPHVKTLSFLPLYNHTYSQAPYIECTEEEYNAYRSTLKPLNLQRAKNIIDVEKFCTNDSCEI